MTEPATSSIRIAPGVDLPSSALRYRFVRSRGPGGQNVNKVNSKAVLRVALDDLSPHLDPAVIHRLRLLAGRRLVDDELLIDSDEHRSQLANRRACLDKLRHLILRATVRPRPRKPTRPTRSAIQQRLAAKKRRSRQKHLRTQRPTAHDW